ncbi:MAG TPA: flagellar biosynthesis protein FliQ [Methylococcaceae bacterium]|nr:flagellar biosynthesis protein FliQ [Methylococcaceae bacterium]HIB62535.1 flagellar biosynthesis protein FliQ [Methylococcaceae bacterium]HIN67722.1 flagellar biosynthesis protein FliQ [Methylococcales bacterium]
MTQGEALDIGREALWVVVLVAGPLLLTALAVGLFVGVIQAATSINEVTLSFIPKLLAIVAALYFFGPWQLTLLTNFATGLIQRIPTLM